jgi:hypothetical protein
MPSALTMIVEAANCGEAFRKDELRRFLLEGMPDGIAYRYEPPPGTVVAALDWQALIGTGADLIAYAGAIWAAYERFVKPRRKKADTAAAQAFLLVHVKRRDGSFAQFALGHEYRDREAFVERFSSEVARLRDGEGPTDEALKARLDESGTWTRDEGGDDGSS